MTAAEDGLSTVPTSTIEDDFPAEVFDGAFYLATYPDVKAAGVDPWAHFMTWGHKEGRIWSRAAEPVAPALRAWADRLPRDERRPVLDLLELIPPEHRASLLADREAWHLLREMTHPVLYRTQLLVESGADEPHGIDQSDAVADAQAQALDSAPTESVDEVLADFLSDGIRRGLRHSALFHEEWYSDVVLRELGRFPDGHPLFHWLAVGYPARVSPTPLFDEEYYVRSHGDMARLGTWTFEHFVKNGCYEIFRVPSPVVNHRLGTGKHSRHHRVPIVADIMLAEDEIGDIRRTSPLEERALMAARLLARLDDPVMGELLARAYEIEPMIRKPYTARKVSLPPVISHAHELFDRAERLRRSLPVSRVDNVVVLPHVRMAGSARVAGAFVRAVHDSGSAGSTMVLTTDLDEFERPDWFPDDVILVDVAQSALGLPAEAQVRLLLDVVRGLQPQRVVNINSALCWSLYSMFGRQLATFTDLHAYLFTWEIDMRGNKGGYPVHAIQDTLSSLTSVLVDSAPLHQELMWRYGHSSGLRGKFHLVHTPAEYGVSTDHSDVFRARREQGRVLRAFWAGRFDRQKRFDLVIDIATMLPDLEIWVWGKVVLGGSDIDFGNLPPNIRLQGTYAHFDDLPVESCDFFLYTAEWDGVPTILIDAAARGVATLASEVGGVGDLITDETGFPIADALEPVAYVAAIEKMVASPDEVSRRAARLRESVRALCSRDAYGDRIALALGLDEGHTTIPEDARP